MDIRDDGDVGINDDGDDKSTDDDGDVGGDDDGDDVSINDSRDKVIVIMVWM